MTIFTNVSGQFSSNFLSFLLDNSSGLSPNSTSTELIYDLGANGSFHIFGSGFQISGRNFDHTIGTVASMEMRTADGGLHLMFADVNTSLADMTAAAGGGGNPGGAFVLDFGFIHDDVLNGHDALADNLNGGDGADTIFGNGGDDFLNGGASDDTIHGGDGSDHISGGGGNDTLHGDGGNDVISGDAGDDEIYGDASYDNLDGGTGNDAFYVTTGDVFLFADPNLGNLFGSMNGGEGTDTIVAGGTNVFFVSPALYEHLTSIEALILDHAVGGTAANDDTFSWIQVGGPFDGALSTSLSITGDNAVADTLRFVTVGGQPSNVGSASAFDGSGFTFADWGADDSIVIDSTGWTNNGGDPSVTVMGTSQADLIIAGGGNDTLDGGGGTDTVRYSGNHYDYTFFGAPGNFTITDHTANRDGVDTLHNFEKIQFADGTFTVDAAFIHDNVLTGGTGDDHIVGGPEDDIVHGGDGSDHISGGGGNDTLHGDGGNDVISGDAGDDEIYGDASYDNLDGGTGNDTFHVTAGDVFLFADPNLGNLFGGMNGGEGTDAIVAGGLNVFFVSPALYERFNSIEALTLDHTMGGSATNDVTLGWIQVGGPFDGALSTSLSITGDNAVADTLRFVTVGAQGSNTGSASAFNGSNFTFTTWSAADSIIIDGSGRPQNEDPSVIITGTSHADQIIGGAGNDTLEGGGGDDWIDGGAGNDTASYASAVAAVTASILEGTASGAGLGSDTFISIENVTGGGGGDALTGDVAANVLSGNGGSDTLFGGAGHDTLYGDDGDDTLVGNDDPFAQESDILDGGNGNDTILAEFTDTILGGAGTDSLYAVNSFNWSINLGATSIEWMQAGFGVDTIDASTQAAGVTIYGGGSGDTITGSNQTDFLWAESGDDTVNGGGGGDVIVGDVGADSLSGGEGDDQIYTDGLDALLNGGNGTDALYITGGAGLNLNMATAAFEWVGDFIGGSDTFDGAGLSANMVAYAGGGTDVITGGSGSDFLWGEAGNDTVTGGGNNDTLVGGVGGDSLNGGAGIDTLFMNSGGGGDGVLDTAVYNAAGWGTDFIYDFEHLTDKINMQGSGATIGAMSFSNVGGHAHVSFGGADLIVVVGQGATLTSADFTF